MRAVPDQTHERRGAGPPSWKGARSANRRLSSLPSHPIDDDEAAPADVLDWPSRDLARESADGMLYAIGELRSYSRRRYGGCGLEPLRRPSLHPGALVPEG